MEDNCQRLDRNHSSNMSESTHVSYLIVDAFLDENSRSNSSVITRSKSPPTYSHSSANSQQQSSQPMRRRVDTEDTHRIQNKRKIPSSDTFSDDSNHDLECNSHDSEYCSNPQSLYHDEKRNLHDEDNYSVISSLTQDEDSFLCRERSAMLSPVMEGIPSPLDSITPPSIVEVSLSNSCRKLAYDDSSLESLMARHGIRDDNFELRQPLSSCCNSLSSSGRLSKTVHSLPQDTWTTQSTFSRRSTQSVQEVSPYSSLMGNRKRRVSQKGYSGTEISLGSIVGQSTLMTTSSGRTLSSSITSSEASSIRRALRSSHLAEDLLLTSTGAGEGIGCCQVRRPKNIIKEELKYVAGKLLQTSPLRKIPFFHEKKPEFQRAKGSLV